MQKSNDTANDKNKIKLLSALQQLASIIVRACRQPYRISDIQSLCTIRVK